MITAIVAYGRNREIGKSGGLIFRMASDLKRFKEETMGHPMIMGRKTYESIGRPLPGRTSIVVSRQAEGKRGEERGVSDGGLIWVDSIEKALEEALKLDTEIFVIGGGEIYRQAMPYLDRLDVTYVDAQFSDADTFFPEHPEFAEYKVTGEGEEQGLKWEYREYSRNIK